MQFSLTELGIKYGTDKVLHQFTNIYDQIFKPIRFSVHRVVEIGVFFGSSVLMWRDYFNQAKIIGLDHFIGLQGNKHTFENSTKFLEDMKANPDPRIELHQVDQSVDDELVNFVRGQVHGVIDIIIDDGSHLMKDQQVTFQRLFSLLRPGGIYVIEDLHTSLQDGYDLMPDKSNSTLLMLQTFKKTQLLRSIYFSETFQGQIESVDIHFTNNGHSITGIIKKACLQIHQPLIQPTIDTVVYLNFSSPSFRISQLRNSQHAAHTMLFPYVISYTELDIQHLIQSNPVMKHPIGFGYWAWKPYLIYATMISTNAKTIVYCDSGSRFSVQLAATLRFGDNHDFTTTFSPSNYECSWTKGDIYEHFGVNIENDKTTQRLCHWIIIRNNDKTRALVHEWMMLAYNSQLITDAQSEAENHPFFIENRHDQSIFSMLSKVRNVDCHAINIYNFDGDHCAFK